MTGHGRPSSYLISLLVVRAFEKGSHMGDAGLVTTSQYQ